MRMLSAKQAVSPAAERTRQFLFHPFELATFLKLAAVACISEGFGFNISFATSRRFVSNIDVSQPLHLSSEMINLMALAVVALAAFCVIVFYLISCFRFVFFHCAAYQTTEIRPVWNRYRPQAIRFFNAGLLVWIVFAIFASGIVFPFAKRFLSLVRQTGTGVQIDSSNLLFSIIPLFVILPALGVTALVVDVVLHDFILPHMALEDASFGAAWKAARGHIAAGIGSFLLYCLLRLLLPLLTLVFLLIVAGIPMLLIFGALSVSANGFLMMIDDPTPLGMVFHTGFQILFVAMAFALGLMVEFGLGGPVATWVRNYALLYYGGRYKALGDLLSATVTQPALNDAPETA